MISKDILVVSFGSSGDTHPLVALAAALKKRGHRVRFVGYSKFESLAAAHGVDFVGYTPPERPAGLQSLSTFARVAQVSAVSLWLYQGLTRHRMRQRAWIGPMQWLYRLIAAQPDPRRVLIVARVSTLGARIAQASLGTSVVTVHLQPSAFRSAHDAPGLPLPSFTAPAAHAALWASIDAYLGFTIAPPLKQFRSELGLPPLRMPLRRWISSPGLVIGFFPEWFGAPQPDWPAHTHLAGFVFLEGNGNRELAPEVERFLNAGAPPLVFTRGSEWRRSRRFFETSVEVCRRMRRRGHFIDRSSGCRAQKHPRGRRLFRLRSAWPFTASSRGNRSPWRRRHDRPCVGRWNPAIGSAPVRRSAGQRGSSRKVVRGDSIVAPRIPARARGVSSRLITGFRPSKIRMRPLRCPSEAARLHRNRVRTHRNPRGGNSGLSVLSRLVSPPCYSL
jgi:hypothetical protein